MKKLGLFALVLGLVVAFALPAFAFTIEGAKGEKMYIGGTFMTEFGYWHRDKELIGGPGTSLSERTEFFTSVPNYSTLRGTLQVGNVGGYWEFGMGGNLLSTTTSGTAGVVLRLVTGKHVADEDPRLVPDRHPVPTLGSRTLLVRVALRLGPEVGSLARTRLGLRRCSTRTVTSRYPPPVSLPLIIAHLLIPTISFTWHTIREH